MRKFIAIFLLLSFAYFAVGWYAQSEAWITQQQYLTFGGIIGALASLMGLAAFFKPPLSRNDIQNIEIESLRKVVEASEEIKRLEEAQSAQISQLDELQKQRKEMELLVRKASMSLFLQEQRKYYVRQIRSYIDASDELSERLNSLADVDQKLEALEEEIEKDPHVEQLKRVIDDSSFTSLSDYSSKSFKSPMTKAMFMLMKTLDEMLTIKI